MHISSKKFLLVLILFLIPLMSVRAQDNQIIVTVSLKLVNQAQKLVVGAEVELLSEDSNYKALQETSDEFGRVAFTLPLVQLSKYTKVKVHKDSVIVHEDTIELNASNLVKIDDESQALPTITLNLPVPEDTIEIKNKIVAGFINQAKKQLATEKSIESFELALGFVKQAKTLNNKQKNPDPEVDKLVIDIFEQYLQYLYAENKTKEGIDLLAKLKNEYPEYENQKLWTERFNLKTLPDEIRTKYEKALTALESGNVEIAISEFSELIKENDKVIPYFQEIFVSQLAVAKEMMVAKILEEALKAFEVEDYEKTLQVLSTLPQYTATISPAALAIEEVVRQKLGMNSRNELPKTVKSGVVKCELKPLGKNTQGYEEFIRSTDGMTVILVPEREITIGDITGNGEVDERPTKKLKLRPFYYDKYEVSNAQYCTFLNSIDPRGLIIRFYNLDSISAQIQCKDNVYMAKKDKDDYPVQNVTWFGANAYSLWAWGHNWRDFEGTDCLLPTAAMYECVSVCTPDKKLIYPWGDEFKQANAVCYRSKMYQWDVVPTAKVMEFSKSESYCGAYNTSGNVWEWLANFVEINSLYDVREEEESFLLKTSESQHAKDFNIKFKEHIEQFISDNPDRADKFKDILSNLTKIIEETKDDSLTQDYIVPEFNYPRNGDYEYNAKKYSTRNATYREYRGGGFTSKEDNLRGTVRRWYYPSKTKHFIGFRSAIFAESQEKHEVDPKNMPKAKFDPIVQGFEFLGKNDKGFREYIRPKDGMVMVEIPAGEFTMGSEIVIDAKPERFVGLDMYLIDKYEVSNGQFYKFLKEYGSDRIKEGEENEKEIILRESIWGFIKDKDGNWVMSGDKDAPAVGVTWFGAEVYARWAKAELVTEAQWEKAARSNKRSTFAWGNEKPDETRSNFISSYTLRPLKVTELENGASPYGCLNMSGNVWEWCKDYYDPEFYTKPEARKLNPVNLTMPEVSKSTGASKSISYQRIARGGGSNSSVKNLRVYIRKEVYESTSSQYLGFRCAYNGKLTVIDKEDREKNQDKPSDEESSENNADASYKMRSDLWKFAEFDSNKEYGGKIDENVGVKLIKTREDGIEFYQRENDGMKVVRVPGGYFKVGDLFNLGTQSERPGKYIWVPEFFMDCNEVSNAQFCKFLNSAKISYSFVQKFYEIHNENAEIAHNGEKYVVTDFADDLPVRFVSFAGANAYSMWAWNLGFSNYDNNSCLPTEAMFEKAASYNWTLKRKHIFSFGDEILSSKGLIINNRDICPVGFDNTDNSYLEIMHLSDNVSEWCVDVYTSETCGKLHQLSVELPQREYMLDTSAMGRVIKGASYVETDMKNLRASYRSHLTDKTYSDSVGFRCAMTTGYYLQPTKTKEDKAVNLKSFVEGDIGLKELGKNYKQCKRFRRLKDSMTMVEIPAGEYNLNTNKDGEFSKVAMQKFLIDETEVTVKMYCEFLNEYQSTVVKDGIYKGKPLYFKDTHSQISQLDNSSIDAKYAPNKGWEFRPVYDITWFGAYEYAKWVGCELPTEAQFEASARGDSTTKYPWGDDEPTYRHACFKIGERLVIPTKVGSYKLGNSCFGIKDLAGNVWEWCLDYYHKDRLVFSNSDNPCDFRYSPKRVIKGGCYNSNAESIQISKRIGCDVDYVYSLVGFRCVFNFPNEVPDSVEESPIR